MKHSSLGTLGRFYARFLIIVEIISSILRSILKFIISLNSSINRIKITKVNIKMSFSLVECTRNVHIDFFVILSAIIFTVTAFF